MKKFIFAVFVAALSTVGQATNFAGLKIYINPGHGGWDANDRNIQTINHALGDTLGFYESKSNLIKGLFLRDLLQQAGATVYISRTLNRTEDDRVLSQIAEEANANSVDAFISIHSNAIGTSNTGTNYLLLLYHGPDNQPVVPQSLALCQAAWPRLMTNRLAAWSHYTTTTNNRGDHSFYGNTTGLGVLRPLTVPGYLSEGSFHDYMPEAHRLLNSDYCRLEALNIYRSYCDYFQRALPVRGEIAGWVKSEDVQMNHPLFTFINGSEDQWLPLNGARVKLMNAAGDSLANYIVDNQHNGIFMFRDLNPGTYRLHFTHTGYASRETTVTVTAATTTYALTKLSVISSSSNAVFNSSISGSWNEASTWTIASGVDADGLPDADDNVFIKATHTVSVNAASACNNITLEGASTGTRLALGNHTIDVSGTLNADGNTLSSSLITCGEGRIRFIGTTRVVIGSSWSPDVASWRFELALNAGQTGTTRTSVSASDMVISSGILAVTGDLRPNNGVANSGSLTIHDGATVTITQRITRIATENTPFGSFTINGNGKLIINGTASNALPIAVGGFPAYSFSAGAQIEYQGGTQAMADINYPNLIVAAGTKTWTLGASTRTVNNVHVLGTAVFLLSGGAPLTVNGDMHVAVGAIAGHGSSANRFVANGSNRSLFLNGTARVTANETQTPAATHPFAFQYSGFTNYVIASTSWISFRSPVTDAIVQGIDAIAGVPFGNVEIVRFTSPTTENTQTFTFKTNVDIIGNLALVRRNDRTLMHINFGANTVKVGGIITKDGPNTSNRDIGRTYNMGTSTFELNGSAAQNTLGSTDMPATFHNVHINNAAGITPQSALVVNGTLQLTQGRLNLGNHNLTVGTISGGSATSYIVTNGTGKVTRSAPATTKLVFPVGTATSYFELGLTPTNATTFSVRLSAGVPQAAPSGRLFYNVTCHVETTNASATELEFTPATPLVAGTGSFVGMWNGTSYDYVTANRTANTYNVQLHSFVPFVVGESDEILNTHALNSKLRMYATNSKLTVEGLTPGMLIAIFNSKGQVVVSQSASNSSHSFVLKSGVYVVQIRYKEQLTSTKVFVY